MVVSLSVRQVTAPPHRPDRKPNSIELRRNALTQQAMVGKASGTPQVPIDSAGRRSQGCLQVLDASELPARNCQTMDGSGLLLVEGALASDRRYCPAVRLSSLLCCAI
jgi:hypothetical protein